MQLLVKQIEEQIALNKDSTISTKEKRKAEKSNPSVLQFLMKDTTA